MPKPEQRGQFFQAKLAKLNFNFTKIDYDEFVNETKGFSYRDMEFVLSDALSHSSHVSRDSIVQQIKIRQPIVERGGIRIDVDVKKFIVEKAIGMKLR